MEHVAPLKLGKGVGVCAILENQPIPVLRDLADSVVTKAGDCVVVLGSTVNNAAYAIIKVSAGLCSEYQAHSLMKELTARTGGGGGGHKGMAQAGGLDSKKLQSGIQYMLEQYCTHE